jgi:NADPH:quinone reductase-like Zn-dependent oxidoreductase
MKAILMKEYGNEDVLFETEVELPAVGEEEVLVEVKAFSINHVDIVTREGDFKAFRPLTFPHLLGLDFVGVVKEVGALCQSIKIGDLVTGINYGGTYTEYITIAEQAVVKLIQDVNVKETAAFPVIAVTAWAAVMDHGLVKPNQKVLIHGGAGGVGHIAIQLAKQAGAYVYTTGAERNTAFLKKLGADEVINYATTDFTTVATDVDVVIDTIGGDVQEKSFQSLKQGGRLISVVTKPSEELSEKYGVYSDFIRGNVSKETMIKLVNDLVAGRLTCHVEKEYPFSLDGVRKAQVELSQGHTRGKRIVII